MNTPLISERPGSAGCLLATWVGLWLNSVEDLSAQQTEKVEVYKGIGGNGIWGQKEESRSKD